MTLTDLGTRLRPIAAEALLSKDSEITKYGIVLAALMGMLEGGRDPEMLDFLTFSAGKVAAYRLAHPLDEIKH